MATNLERLTNEMKRARQHFTERMVPGHYIARHLHGVADADIPDVCRARLAAIRDAEPHAYLDWERMFLLDFLLDLHHNPAKGTDNVRDQQPG